MTTFADLQYCLDADTVVGCIIEKSRVGRFFMEQELRFGLDLGRFGNF